MFEVGDKVYLKSTDKEKYPGRVACVFGEVEADSLKGRDGLPDGSHIVWENFKYSIFLGKGQMNMIVREDQIEKREDSE